MAKNPKEKQFVIFMNPRSDVKAQVQDFIENKMSSPISDSKNYFHWLRTMGGNMYLIGTLEDTNWTVAKIISSINKNVKDSHSMIAFDITNSSCQGLMSSEEWDFFKKISNDLTNLIDNLKRSKKLNKIKELIKKQDELKRKELALKEKEKEISKKKEFIDAEAELVKKELELKEAEEELRRKEEEINENKKKIELLKKNSSLSNDIPIIPKKKRFLGIF